MVVVGGDDTHPSVYVKLTAIVSTTGNFKTAVLEKLNGCASTEATKEVVASDAHAAANRTCFAHLSSRDVNYCPPCTAWRALTVLSVRL